MLELITETVVTSQCFSLSPCCLRFSRPLKTGGKSIYKFFFLFDGCEILKDCMLQLHFVLFHVAHESLMELT